MTAYGSAETNGYDGDGLRTWKISSLNTTYYLYDGDQSIGIYDGTGTLGGFNTFGADGLVSRRYQGATTFYTYDERGNTSQRTSSTGAVTSTDAYDAYGSRTSTASSQPDPRCFEAQAGYYSDVETGLVLCTHRFYDPSAGRFVTRDPIDYYGGVNLYGYTHNNPSNRNDPTGYLSPVVIIIIIIVVVFVLPVVLSGHHNPPSQNGAGGGARCPMPFSPAPNGRGGMQYGGNNNPMGPGGSFPGGSGSPIYGYGPGDPNGSPISMNQ